MRFEARVGLFKEPVSTLSIGEVWNFRKEELSIIANAVLKRIGEPEGPLTALAGRAGLLAQCAIEFQDLINMPLPREGRFANTNYLFFEGLAALREATLSGCGGQIHASFATLRSALEMFTLHHWWHERLFFADSYEEFYDWLEGRRKPPPFRNALEENYKVFTPPPTMAALEQARSIYEFLCSYSHRPLLTESTVRMRGGNATSVPSDSLLKFWLEGLEKVTRLLVEQMIAARPECLFPVDLHKKFGFNPPVGMYFDQHNWIILKSTFSSEQLEKFQVHYRDHHIVTSLKEWLASLPDLSDEEALATWNGEEMNDTHLSVRERLDVRTLHQKAQSRVISWGFAYGIGRSNEELALPRIELPRW